MKLKAPFLLALALSLFMTTVSGATSVDSFRFQAPLETNGHNGAMEFTVPAPLLKDIRQAGDMRIIDGKGSEVPFVLAIGTFPERKMTSYWPATYNHSFMSGKYQSFEFELPQGLDSLNRLDVEAAQLDYDRTVTLLGKEKGRGPFKVIKEGMRLIRYDLPDQSAHFKHNELLFPTQKLALFQVRISLPSGEKPLTIEQIKLEHQDEAPGQKEDVAFSVESNVGPELKEKLDRFWPLTAKQGTPRDYYVLTPAFPQLPLDQFSIDLGGDHFTRQAQLYALRTGDKDAGLELVHCGLLFKYGDEKSPAWKFPPVRAEKFLLVVDHGHDEARPLHDVHGGHLRHAVLFISGSERAMPLTLFFGSEPGRWENPRYDLEEYLRRNVGMTFQKVSVGKVEANGSYRESFSLEKKWPHLLYIVVISMVLGLGYYLWTLLRKNPA